MDNTIQLKKQPTWCDGCGNYGIMSALTDALSELELDMSKVILCFDVGCNGNGHDKITGQRVHTLHGRSIPTAVGIKLARPDYVVIAMSGDGATYAEGISHFTHSIRNDYNITFLCHDNGLYGLTTGQCSPTSEKDIPYNSNPNGNNGHKFNPLSFANALGCNFIGQGFSGEMKSLKELIKLSVQNQINMNGFSFLNMLQACPTYNKVNTHESYIKNVINYQSAKYTYNSKLLQNYNISDYNIDIIDLINDKPHQFCGIAKIL